MKSTFCFVSAVVVAFAVPLCAAEQPLVDTDSGSIVGEALADGMAVFRGVPYAAPPIGELRWKEPQPAANWDGALDCTAFGNVAPQSNRLAQMTGETFPETSEDCLYLNVWTTNLDGDEPLVASSGRCARVRFQAARSSRQTQ